MKQVLCKSYWLTLLLLTGCNCDDPHTANNDVAPPSQQKKYYNLEAIDLTIEAKGELSFVYNNQQLTKEGDLYLSKDLVVYPTKDGKWQATVIGQGGISSKLKINADQKLLQEVAITTTNQVIAYKEELGKEWPGMYNIGNTCFANSVYKLIARCSGFDQALSKDVEEGINTALRNIVNGIRLGHRSALKEELVNRKLGALLLDKLEKADSMHRFNNRKQYDVEEFLLSVVNLLYPKRPISDEDVEALLEMPTLDNPLAYILKEKGGEFDYSLISLITYASNYFFVKLPLFDVVITQSQQVIPMVMPHELVRPYYDYKTEKKIGEKKYKLIAVVHHIGSSMSSGHYVAYINHGTQGWYLQDDTQVKPVPAPHSINTMKCVGLYEPDDQL
jgi:hypothetical protein